MAIPVGALLGSLPLAGQASMTWHDPPAEAELAGAEVRAVTVGSDGSVWLAVAGRGLARLEDGAVRWVHGAGDGIPSGVSSLHEDRTGRLWAAGVGGFSVFDDGRWERQETLGALRPPVVFGIHETTGGTMWMAANGGAAYRTSAGWGLIEPADGLPHAVVHAVVVDRSGVAWLACRRGLARAENGTISVFHPEVNFRSAAVGLDGTLWFGTADGLYTWNGTSWGRHLEGQAAYPILVDVRGVVWAGSRGSGLLRYEDARWSTIELPERLRDAEVFDLAEAAGVIWVATSKGAARLGV